MKHGNLFIVGVLGVIAISEASVLFFSSVGTPGRINRYARSVISTCASASFAPSCYDSEIPKLLDRISMEEAFEVTRRIQEQDEQYRYCHVLGHNLSYKETEKDSTKWKDVVTRCPQTMCNNGCLHGALMRRFNTEVLTDAQIELVKPDFSDVCEPRGSWRPTEVERSMCYHTLGHLAMYITNADIPKSAALCLEIGTKPDGRNYVQTCTEGVLMTVFQPLEPEDKALVARFALTSKEEAERFCRQFTQPIWEVCRREAWPLYSPDMRAGPDGLLRYCSYAADRIKRRTCNHVALNSLTVSLVIEEGGTIDHLASYCEKLPGEDRTWCYGNAAMRLIQIDPAYEELALAVCEKARQAGVGDYCYDGLLFYGSYSFHKGSRRHAAYCKKLPAGLDQRCLRGDIPEGFW